MASFDTINYSLRPNKFIERGIAFEGIRRLARAIDLSKQVYIGFGSIWFVDFQLAHRLLGIKDMRSMESDPIGYSRACFNRPYKTVQVKNMISSAALPELYQEDSINKRPWLIWLDYDSALNEEQIEDIRSVIENCPTNSIFLVTFSATPGAYGKPNQRDARLRTLLGDVVPDDLSVDDKTINLPKTLANLTLDFMKSCALTMARPGGFKEAFKLVYTDSATMVTVGGMLPALGAAAAAREVVDAGDWPALVNEIIAAPHLTLRETVILQSQLPAKRHLTRKNIQKLGFDLRDDQITSFEKYYMYYPSFAQISV